MEIVSTMGGGSLGREIDLEALISELDSHLSTFTEPNFTNRSVVTFRLETEGPAFTLYRTGSFQIRGARNKQQLIRSEDRLKKVLSEVGFDIPNYDFDHHTSVFIEDIDQEIDLESLMLILGMESTEYEPEQFSGLIYRPEGFELTIVIFSNGKTIIGGTTDRDEAISAVQYLITNLNSMSST
jgi:transcription initiation factor TFIID TATA-box-binding protein